MSSSITRIGDAFDLGPNAARLMTLLGLIGGVAIAALATRQGVLILVLALALGGIATIVGIRWPLLPLMLFAALIPIEQVVIVEGLGTISRLAGILFAVCYGVPRLGQLSLRAMPPAAWAFLAWALVSLGWAIDPETTLPHLVTLAQLFVIAALIADFVVHRPAIVRPVLWVYSLSAAATALIGIQFYIAQGLSSTRAVAIADQDPAFYAAVLVPALFFGLYEVLRGDHRIAGGIVALLTTAGVVVSGTRGAWVACAIAFALFILPQLTPRGRLAAVAMGVAFLVAAYQIPGVADMVAERTSSALSTGGAGRTDIWSAAATIYGSSPVFGVGYANFTVAYTSDVVRASNVLFYLYEGANSHNVVVGTLVELGPLGLLILIAFVGSLVLRRGYGVDAPRVQAMLASLLTVSIFVDIFGNQKQVWLLIGCAAGLVFLAQERRPVPGSVEMPEPSVPATPSRTARFWW
jgi:O-antigen ligase